MFKGVKILEAAFIAIAIVFTPIKNLLLTTGIMIFVDLISGILAARKRNESITSSGLRRTLTKLFVYESAIMLAFLTEHYMSDVLPFIKMASAMISIVELKSVYENLNEISGSDLLKSLINKLGSNNQ